MTEFVTVAMRPTVSAADRAALLSALQTGAQVRTQSKGAVGDWIEWLLEVKRVVDSVGGTAGAIAATATLGQAVVKWRRGDESEPAFPPHTVVIHAPGAEALDLTTATDEEIVAWFRQLSEPLDQPDADDQQG